MQSTSATPVEAQAFRSQGVNVAKFFCFRPENMAKKVEREAAVSPAPSAPCGPMQLVQAGRQRPPVDVLRWQAFFAVLPPGIEPGSKV